MHLPLPNNPVTFPALFPQHPVLVRQSGKRLRTPDSDSDYQNGAKRYFSDPADGISLPCPLFTDLELDEFIWNEFA